MSSWGQPLRINVDPAPRGSGKRFSEMKDEALFTIFYGTASSRVQSAVQYQLQSRGWYLTSTRVTEAPYWRNDQLQQNYYPRRGTIVTWEESRQTFERAMRPPQVGDRVTIIGSTTGRIRSGFKEDNMSTVATVAQAQAKLRRAERLANEAELELAEAEAQASRWGWLDKAANGTIIKFKRNFGRTEVYSYGAIKVDQSWYVTGPRQAGLYYSSSRIAEEFLDHAIAEGFDIEQAKSYKVVMAGE